MPSEKNIRIVKEIEEKFEGTKAIIIANFKGVKVDEINNLRKRLKGENISFKVYKNRLAKIAFKEKDVQGIESLLDGPSAFAFGYDDPVTTAKVLYEFSKSNENFKIKGGLFEGKLINGEDVVKIAKIPSKDVLLASLVGSLSSSITGLVFILKGMMTSFVYTLESIVKQKEE
ncbi:50S ribosomal protein L10 [candidate division WOR-3 bacterium]|nr:50S ribosomal protein L10 [candidate division WOR-3 bacterium]